MINLYVETTVKSTSTISNNIRENVAAVDFPQEKLQPGEFDRLSTFSKKMKNQTIWRISVAKPFIHMKIS